jgi:hypothetical protein
VRAGAFFANFSPDLSVQFSDNSEFFVQWRQRFSPEMFETFFVPGGEKSAWKQTIISTGDKVGCRPGSTSNCGEACTALEIVNVAYADFGFPVMYDSCETCL